MAGVQLIGRQNIIAAVEAKNAEGFALFDGKRPIVAGDTDELCEWLDRFDHAGSTATYTLKLFDTPVSLADAAIAFPVASFNIKIVDNYAGQGIAGYSNKLEQRIGELEKKLEGQGDDDEDDLEGIVMGYLREPDKLETAIGAIMQIFGKTPAAKGAAIAGAQLPVDKEQKLIRLTTALDKLEQRNPQLLMHLEKLAALAESDPDMFNLILKKIDNL